MLRSGCCSFTQSSRRSALARQLTRRTRSPGCHSRRSANSIPSPRARATWLPAKTCVSSGATSERSVSSRRVDAQRLRARRAAPPTSEAEPVAGADEHRPERERAPAVAAQRQLERPRPRRRAGGRAAWPSLGRSSRGSGRTGRDGRRRADEASSSVAVTSSPSSARSRSSGSRDRDLRLACRRTAATTASSERRRERDRLDPAEREARDEPGRREPGVRRRAAAR